MRVPLADLHRQYLQIKSELDPAIQDVITNSQFILGKAVADFEREFAASQQSKHCVAVGSGTDALHAALWASGVRAGDAVVTTPFTFIATLEAISLTGATPVFVDIDERTFNMKPELLEALLASGKHPVKAIIPIHLYGQPAEMDKIMALAKRFGVRVIEDVCQAHASKFHETYLGNFGSAGCFSFYPGKNLGAFGEAGAITTNDDDFALMLRRLRDHGQVEKYKHGFIGHNYRMDGIQGAVLGTKLKHLKQWTDRRREIASRYKQLLANTGDIILPYEIPRGYHVYHLFTIRTRQRSALQQYLAEKEIATAVAYPIPLHFQEAYKHLGYRPGDFRESERASEECLSLPMFAELTDEQVEYVAASIKGFFSREAAGNR